MKTYRLTVSYNGRDFDGWQRLKDSNKTIQGILENAISQEIGENLEVTASGRTDAGVHARAQVCSFSCNKDVNLATFVSKVNGRLPKTISVLEISRASDRFNARIHARSKTYCYQVWNHNSNPGIYSDAAVGFGDAVDLKDLEYILKLFVGTYDFNAFATRSANKNTVRTVTNISVTQDMQLLKIFVTGDGFLHNMVRNIVGVAMACAQGKVSKEDIRAALLDRTYDIKGFKAPAKGLTLWQVDYD